MSQYKHLLLATDLVSYDEPAILRAATLAKAFDAKLSLLHVVEPIPAYAEITPLNVEDELVAQAKTQLQELGQKLNVPIQEQYVRVGPPKHEIIDAAKELNVDLIVMGSHGRHGLSLLLGSTANAVVHGAACDVITVRSTA
jgi:universal stress protein A